MIRISICRKSLEFPSGISEAIDELAIANHVVNLDKMGISYTTLFYIAHGSSARSLKKTFNYAYACFKLKIALNNEMYYVGRFYGQDIVLLMENAYALYLKTKDDSIPTILVHLFYKYNINPCKYSCISDIIIMCINIMPIIPKEYVIMFLCHVIKNILSEELLDVFMKFVDYDILQNHTAYAEIEDINLQCIKELNINYLIKYPSVYVLWG